MEGLPFFMVFLEGGSAPTYRHTSLESAEIEAKRLTKIHGKKAFVLCTIKSFVINEFTVQDMRPELGELPF